MVDLGKIQGDKLSSLLRHLVEQKTILSVRLLGTNYERLTYITDIDDSGSDKSITIDLPEGFSRVVADKAGWRMAFNFNGPDNIEYLFEVQGGEMIPDGVRISYPLAIERLQRRSNFRVMTPSGTRMAITIEAKKGLINLINISLGGAYGVITKHNFSGRREPFLDIGQNIDRVGIIFPEDYEQQEQIVVINKSRVVRIDHDQENNLYKYAFEFIEIDAVQQRKLTQCIYHIQRQSLMRR